MIINGNCKYTTADGREVDYSEDIRHSDTGWGKYSNAMAHYLSRCDTEDEWTGSVESPTGYVQRFGKRLLFSDNRGFVTCDKYGTVEEAQAAFNEADDAYSAWADENEDGF